MCLDLEDYRNIAKAAHEEEVQQLVPLYPLQCFFLPQKGAWGTC
jgi:hypothetical protein